MVLIFVSFTEPHFGSMCVPCASRTVANQSASAVTGSQNRFLKGVAPRVVLVTAYARSEVSDEEILLFVARLRGVEYSASSLPAMSLSRQSRLSD